MIPCLPSRRGLDHLTFKGQAVQSLCRMQSCSAFCLKRYKGEEYCIIPPLPFPFFLFLFFLFFFLFFSFPFPFPFLFFSPIPFFFLFSSFSSFFFFFLFLSNKIQTALWISACRNFDVLLKCLLAFLSKHHYIQYQVVVHSFISIFASSLISFIYVFLLIET